MTEKKIILLIVVLFLIENLYETKTETETTQIGISEINLLLPFHPKIPISYKIHAQNGCFKWSSSRPSVVNVETLFENSLDCSQSAIITATSKSSDRTSAMIYAEEKVSGQVLRCEVFVDKITKIEILTRSRTIYVDSSIELLEVQGYDSEGNVFSSLSGISFDWEINSKGKNILSKISVEKAFLMKPFVKEYEETKEWLEDKGSENTNILLVQGISTGKADVTASIKDDIYRDIEKSTVTISVMEPIQIQPFQNVYLIPKQQFQYNLILSKREKQELIKMPNTNYKWRTTNPEIATIDQRGMLTAKSYGSTEILVTDQNIAENEARATVYVVKPEKIKLAIHDVPQEMSTNSLEEKMKYLSIPNFQSSYWENSYWALFINNEHILEIELIDKDLHKIWINKNTGSFSIKFSDPKILTIVEESKKHETVNFKTKNYGETTATAIFKSGDINLSTEEKITVTKQISVNPSPVLRLAFWENLAIPHTYKLDVSGGSGSFVFKTDMSQIASVNAIGMVSGIKPGESKLKVSDQKNPKNYEIITVVVEKPSSIQIVAPFNEIEVGKLLELEIQAYDSKHNKFHNSSLLPIQWKMSNMENFELKKHKQMEQILTKQGVLAHHEGFSTITASLLGNGFEEQINAHIQIAGFFPLEVKHFPNKYCESKNLALTTLGCSATVLITGGPLPWGDSPEFIQEILPQIPDSVMVSNSERVGVTQQKIPNQSSRKQLISISCIDYSKQQIAVKVRNTPSKTNPNPITAEIDFAYECNPPEKIFVFPMQIEDELKSQNYLIKDPENQAHKCPYDLQNFPKHNKINLQTNIPKQYQMRNEQKVKIVALFADSQGRIFEEFDSLMVSFVSENPLANFENLKEKKNKAELDMEEYETRYAKEDVITLGKEIGTAKINVKTTGFGGENKALIKNTKEWTSKLSLEDNMRIILVSKIQLFPKKIVLFNNETSTGILDVVPKTTTYDITSNDSSIAHLKQISNKGSVEVIPKSRGVARVFINDYCLQGSVPAYADVVVSEISKIALFSQSKLQLGDKMKVRVEIYDDLGNKFPVKQMKFINLIAIFDRDVLSSMNEISEQVSKAIEKDGDATSFDLEFKGISLGLGKIHLQAKLRNGDLTESNTRKVVIFPPLMLNPRFLLLLPDSEHQLTKTGGPQLYSEIRFRSEDPNIASVDKHGIVKGIKEGKTKITAEILENPNEISESEIVLSRDQIDVSVQILKGIRIQAESSLLLTGNERTYHVSGITNENVFSFSSLKHLGDYLRFDWEVSNKDVLEISALCGQDSGFSVLAKGKNTGTSILRVTAKSKTNKKSNELSDETTINVIDRLTLLSPQVVYLPPRSGAKIETNWDLREPLQYRVMKTSSGEKENQESKDDLISVDLSGKVYSKDRYGIGYVVVEPKQSDIPTRRAAPEKLDSLAVQIVVKPVSSLSLIPIDACYSVLPLGASLTYKAILKDSLGNSFTSSDGIKFNYEGTNPTSISVQHFPGNSTFLVKALNDGSSVLKVWLRGQPEISDFVKIQAGGTIFPHNPNVHIGAQIKFHSPDSFSSLEIKSGSENYDPKNFAKWISSDPKIVEIDEKTGIATAKNSGKASIFYTTQKIRASTEIVVAKADSITVNTDSLGVSSILGEPNTILIGSTQKEYKIPLIFTHENAPFSPSSSFLQHNFRHTCEIGNPQYGTAQAMNDPHNSQAYCLLTIFSSHKIAEKIKTNPNPELSRQTNLKLLITVSDSDQSYALKHFHTINLNLGIMLFYNPNDLHFSKNHRSATVIVYSDADHLDFSSEDPSQIRIYKVRFDEKEYEGVLLANEGGESIFPQVFHIQLTDEPKFFTQSKVIFKDTKTNQVEILTFSFLSDSNYIPNNYDQPRQLPPSQAERQQSKSLFVLVSSLLLAVIVVGVYLFRSYQQNLEIERIRRFRQFSPISPRRSPPNLLRNKHIPPIQTGQNYQSARNKIVPAQITSGIVRRHSKTGNF
ncbi:nuclear pore membrane glycoprotein [Anaeramoeba ignava]|uniref:Nuclear pore membrane glycoprotein n=1 Tax=Anaeramoeba ignava TaxID=1746090 RepID=A0A9Q0LDU0_ANAIG|nr:nuclear pore membrane glycoprotein [Anaeramoeba ignava]